MKFGTWAKAALMTPDGQVLLLRRSSTDEQRAGDWDFPGGNIEPGEDITAGLLREIQEESGQTLSLNDVRLVYVATQRYDTLSVNRLLYIAKAHGMSVELSSEHDAFEWVSLDEVIEKFKHPFYAVGLQYARDNGLLDS